MAMNQANSPANPSGAVVLDANVLVALCAQEQDKFILAETTFNDYFLRGWQFYAPGVLLSETLYVLCGKLQNGTLTPTTHTQAIGLLQNYLTDISSPPSGDFSLATRAEAIRQSYGCSRSADGLYIALAEELAQQSPTELLTFDQGMVNQAAKNAPAVKVNLLIP